MVDTGMLCSRDRWKFTVCHLALFLPSRHAADSLGSAYLKWMSSFGKST